MEDKKVKFYHPSGKSGKLSTSKGTVVLDEEGTAMVSSEMYEHLMKIPGNAEYLAKLKAAKEKAEQQKRTKVPTLEEFVKAGYKKEDYEFHFCGFKAGDIFDEVAIQENQSAELQRREEERIRAEAGNTGKEDQLKEEDLKLLDIKALKAIAGKRKIEFEKSVKPEELIQLILATQEPKQ